MELWAKSGSATKRLFAVHTSEPEGRSHVVGVGSGGCLWCTCGGVTESLVPCKEIRACVKSGHVAVNILVHSAPCVQTVEALALSVDDRRPFTVVLLRTCGAAATAPLAIALDGVFNAAIAELDAASPSWRNVAVTLAPGAAVAAGDGARHAEGEAVPVSRTALADSIELGLTLAVSAMRSLPRTQLVVAEWLKKVLREAGDLRDELRQAAMVVAGVA